MPLNSIVQDCEDAFISMQEHIRLQHWDQLDHASKRIASAMDDLACALPQQHIPQTALIRLSLLQRRVTRTLHNAMLSNRHDVSEVSQGLRQLQQKKENISRYSSMIE